MSKTVHCCTFTLDESTAAQIWRLASLWNVSQDEVVLRAVANAGAQTASSDGPTQLHQLH